MSKAYPLQIKAVEKETDDCTVVSFDVPDELKAEFQFQQGQHLTLERQNGDETIRRSYSLCSSPVDDEWQVAVKEIPEGRFSTFINRELKANDQLNVLPPSGEFGVPVDTKASKNYLFFAAGSGITPIISMIKTHLSKEPNSKCQLFYLNKTAKSIIFKERLEQLRNQFFGRLEIYYFLTREQRDIELFNGRLDADKINTLCNTLIDIDEVDDVFICGPEQMLFTIRDTLVENGLPKDKVYYELFVTGLSEEDKARVSKLREQQKNGSKITILDGGKEFHFTMSQEDDNVLDAGLKAGADLPFACKGGVCSTCKCKIIEGEAEMKINYALEEDELKKNYLLSCQAIPTTDHLVIDYDV
jgi:ring-1,2-phenylacetyl-CoA epoxidase subunit PaaE